jgi:hypothetical protein
MSIAITVGALTATDVGKTIEVYDRDTQLVFFAGELDQVRHGFDANVLMSTVTIRALWSSLGSRHTVPADTACRFRGVRSTTRPATRGERMVG